MTEILRSRKISQWKKIIDNMRPKVEHRSVLWTRCKEKYQFHEGWGLIDKKKLRPGEEIQFHGRSLLFNGFYTWRTRKIADFTFIFSDGTQKDVSIWRDGLLFCAKEKACQIYMRKTRSPFEQVDVRIYDQRHVKMIEDIDVIFLANRNYDTFKDIFPNPEFPNPNS